MLYGMVLAACAFIVSGFLESAIQRQEQDALGDTVMSDGAIGTGICTRNTSFPGSIARGIT